MTGHDFLGWADLPRGWVSFRCSCGVVGEGLVPPSRSYDGDWRQREFVKTIRDEHRQHVETATGEFSFAVEHIAADAEPSAVETVHRGADGPAAMIVARNGKLHGDGRWFFIAPAGAFEILANGWTRQVGF